MTVVIDIDQKRRIRLVRRFAFGMISINVFAFTLMELSDTVLGGIVLVAQATWWFMYAASLTAHLRSMSIADQPTARRHR